MDQYGCNKEISCLLDFTHSCDTSLYLEPKKEVFLCLFLLPSILAAIDGPVSLKKQKLKYKRHNMIIVSSNKVLKFWSTSTAAVTSCKISLLYNSNICNKKNNSLLKTLLFCPPSLFLSTP